MWISDFAIRKPVVTIVLMLTLVLFGIVALLILDTDEFPEVNPPVVAIGVLYPGASPSIVEREVVDPIEDALSGITGVDRISSTSFDSYGFIVVEYVFEKDLQEGTQDIRDKISEIRQDLPLEMEEPVITAMMLTPSEFVGPILQLCQDKRGVQKKLEYLKSDRVLVTYELPFNEVVMDFYDKLKTISRGYASLDYHVTGYWESPLVKMDILVNGDPVDALSIIVHKDAAYDRGRALATKMRELIPRQMFEIAIQASIGNRVIARESVKALRKNVLAKCYGGDITRKRKLLEKQKEGKKRMKRVGRVEIPQEAFLAVLKVGTE